MVTRCVSFEVRIVIYMSVDFKGLNYSDMMKLLHKNLYPYQKTTPDYCTVTSHYTKLSYAMGEN
jgi:hypothetical protein